MLLVQEEYKVFEDTLKDEQADYVKTQHEALIKMAWRIESLIDFELEQSESGHIREHLLHVADVFSEHAYRFVNLYAPDGKALYEHVKISSGQVRRVDSQDGVLSGPVTYLGVEKNALLYSKTLHKGYKIITGIYTENAEEIVEQRYREMRHRLIRVILEIVTLAYILFALILAINKVFSTLQERDVTTFLDFFRRATEQDVVIDPKSILFKEFKSMVEYANKMVTTIASQRRSLQELNLSLEDKVKEKTVALEVKNFALEKEKAYSQKLLKSQKQFIRYAIHETNTPLSVILTNIELYHMNFQKNRYLSKIEASVKNIFSIFDDLGYLVKKDQIEYPKKSIDLDAYVRSRVDFFTEVADQAGLVLMISSSCHDAKITFNETKLQRIIDNNLTNAIKYTYRDETIFIRLDETEATCRFTIASHSQLIEDTKRVFEAFYREKSKEEGFGLGLDLVKSICDEENVKISLVSDEHETLFSYTFVRER